MLARSSAVALPRLNRIAQPPTLGADPATEPKVLRLDVRDEAFAERTNRIAIHAGARRRPASTSKPSCWNSPTCLFFRIGFFIPRADGNDRDRVRRNKSQVVDFTRASLTRTNRRANRRPFGPRSLPSARHFVARIDATNAPIVCFRMVRFHRDCSDLRWEERPDRRRRPRANPRHARVPAPAPAPRSDRQLRETSCAKSRAKNSFDSW